MHKTVILGTLGLLLLGAAPASQPAGGSKEQTDAASARLQDAQATTQPAAMTNRQLSRLRAELASLRAENTRLKAEITKLKAAQATAAPMQEQAGAGGPANEIQRAIKERRIVNGMTVEQANRSLSVKFARVSASSSGEVYSAIANLKVAPLRPVGRSGWTGGDATGTKYTLEVKDGIVTYWNSEPYYMAPGTAGTVR